MARSPSAPEPTQRWPSIERQLDEAKAIHGSKFEEFIRANQETNLLRPEEHNGDGVGVPLWLRVYYRKQHPTEPPARDVRQRVPGARPVTRAAAPGHCPMWTPGPRSGYRPAVRRAARPRWPCVHSGPHTLTAGNRAGAGRGRGIMDTKILL